VLWRRGVDVSIRSVSKLYIDMDVMDLRGRKWRFTGVYGESHSDQKFRTWEALWELSATNDGPWMCAGDFNEILYSHEKEGGRARPQSCMDLFKETLEVTNLQDLGFLGDIFTWRNHNHRVEGYIRERLDVRSGELFSLLYEILMEILGTLITVRSSSQQRGRSYVGEEDTGVVLNLKLAGWKKMVVKR
jgi:hypothetical protein